MRLFFVLHTFLIAAFLTQLRRCYSGLNPPHHCISNFTLSKLSNSYHVKNDIINYGRFKYVYTIKNHPIQHVTTRILDYLKRESSFWVVYNKCPLYQRNSCFNDILIKNTNDTTSVRNNFYFSDSLLYIPQATSLFPYVCHLLRGEQKGRHVPPHCGVWHRTEECSNPQWGWTPNGDMSTKQTVIRSECAVEEATEGEVPHLPLREHCQNGGIGNAAEGGERTAERSERTVEGRERTADRRERTADRRERTADRRERTAERESCCEPPELYRGRDNFLIISNIFRKDNIDKLHFPFFNQMDIYIKIKNELVGKKKQLLYFLCSLLDSIFGKTHKWRIKKDSFDFTSHSLQAEVYHNDKWVEILGCGILKKKILFKKWKQYDVGDYLAIGLGLDRMAMIICDVNRIRDLYLYITNTGGNTLFTKKMNTEGGRIGTVGNMIRHDDIPGGGTCGDASLQANGGASLQANGGASLQANGDASVQANGPAVREEPTGDENILVDSPKLEGTHLRNALLNRLSRKRDPNRPKSDSFLYFLNLYNVRHEERDVSFYVNSKWDTELFTKTVLHFAPPVGGSRLLRRVILLDVFNHEGSGRTSYTYKFLYAAPASIR
ncbi:phenylalanyl-tRNA synthetase alpha chain, partial [Plasmodium cynomolgi strain B]